MRRPLLCFMCLAAPVLLCFPSLSLAKFVVFCVRFVSELSVGFCLSWLWSPLAASRVACGRRSWVKVTYEFVKLEATEPAAEGDQARPAPSPPKHSVDSVSRHWPKSLSG